MTPKKRYKDYLQILRVSTSNYGCYKTGNSTKQKWCASTTSCVILDTFDKFMKGKPSYTYKELIKKVLKEYYLEINVFLKQSTDILPDHRDENHKIELLKGKQTVFIWNYQLLSEQETDVMKKYIDKHLRKSFMRLSLLAMAALVLLAKKLESRLRFCIDYKTLNTITVKNRYPILLIKEMLGKLLNTKQFTKLDIIYVFNRICIKKGQECLTAFNTRYGQFEYLVMLFGLCNALRTFQSYINSLLQEYLEVFCTAYLENILICSENNKEHTSQMLKILKQMREKDLQLNIDKCEFSVTKVKYLGLIVTTKRICMDPEKVQAIIN